jgi:hypothetical protein
MGEVAYNIFSDQTTNITSAYATIPVGGLYQLEVDGTFNGATVTFSSRGCKGSALASKDSSGTAILFTSAGQALVCVSAYEAISGTISAAGASTNLTAMLRRVPYSS